MRVYVINLKENNDRKSYMQKQLVGLDFEFVDAINGKLLFDELNKSVNHFKLKWLISGRPLTAGQLGVFFSHKKLWEKCIKLNEPLIILEDDSEINQNHKNEYINAIKSNIAEFEFLRLESIDSARFRVKKNNDLKTPFYEIFKLEENRNSTGGYAIHPNAAKKLLEYSDKIYCPVDNYIGDYSYHKMDSYLFSPYFLYDRGAFQSTIEISNIKKNIPFYIKITREIYKVYFKFRQYLYFRKHIPSKRL